MRLTFAASSGLEAANSGLFGLFAAAAMFLLFEDHSKRPRWKWVLAVSAVGLVLSLSYFIASSLVLFVAAAAALLALFIVGLLGEDDSQGQQAATKGHGWWRPGSWWPWGLAIVGGVAGVVIGHWVLSSSPHSTAAPSYKPFYSEVYGTCANAHCGLNEHSKPTNERATIIGPRRADGSPVTVLCQTRGANVTDPPDQHSAVWDMLDDHHYVSDLFVRTPGSRRGRFSRQIERCH